MLPRKRSSRSSESSTSGDDQEVGERACALVEKVVGGGLIKKIEQVVERQFKKQDKGESQGTKLKDINGAQTSNSGEYEREKKKCTHKSQLFHRIQRHLRYV